MTEDINKIRDIIIKTVPTEKIYLFGSYAYGTPNAETVAAMLEAEQIEKDPSIKRYSDVEEALRELKL